jgi:hypothetical protein
MELTHEDLIGDIPIYAEGIGHIKIPTLHEIWVTRYKTYEGMLRCLVYKLGDYLKDNNLQYKYDESKITFYDVIIQDSYLLKFYNLIFSFFIVENVLFDECNKVFIIWEEHDNKKIAIGQINKDNFDEIIDILLKVNYIKSVDENYEKPKYKNNFAKKLVERMEKANVKKSQGNSTSFGKMISKYCADNKNGINILNVWDMTIYQFYDQFMQHNHIRQSDIQDMVYANTVSYSDLKAYDSQLWLK